MDNDSIKYWIWLQCCFGVDNKKLSAAIDFFGDAENIYNAGEEDYNRIGIFSKTEMAKLCDKNLDYSEKTVELCLKNGYSIIPYMSEFYPKRLSEISSPPVVLYVLGKLPEDKDFHVGIVGTRNAGETGTSLSYNFGYDLAVNGAVTVSGGAYGVDIYSHRGTVDAGGRTICVIGCGINMLNGGMADYILTEIPKRGAIVSEYPPGYPPTKFTFPMRNRIISGMSDCTVVVRAGLGSGALITVKYAIEQKRKIFAVPGDLAHANAVGVNFLIKNGFSPALGYNDILDWYRNRDKDDNEVNPKLEAKFLRTLAIKPDNPDMHIDGRRVLNVPMGYKIISELCRKGMYYCKPVEEDLKLFEENKEKYNEEVFENGSETYEISENTELTEEERKEREREADMKYMDEMWQRQIAGEPEPPSSPASRVGGLMDSDYQKRAIELRRIIKKYNLNVGLDYNIGKRMAQMILEEMDINFVKKQLEEASDEMRPYVLKALEVVEEKERVKAEKRKAEKEKAEKEKSEKVKSTGQRRKRKSTNLDKSDKKRGLKSDKESKISEKQKKINEISKEELTENALAVYYTISETPIHVNEIKNKTGLEIGEALSALSELQLYGLITKVPGGRYIRT